MSRLGDLAGRSEYVYWPAAIMWQTKGLAWGLKREGIMGQELRPRESNTKPRAGPTCGPGRGCFYTFQSHVRVYRGGTDRACATHWEANVHSYCTAMDTQGKSSWRVAGAAAGERRGHWTMLEEELRPGRMWWVFVVGVGSKRVAGCWQWRRRACTQHGRGKSFATSHQAVGVACWIG